MNRFNYILILLISVAFLPRLISECTYSSMIAAAADASTQGSTVTRCPQSLFDKYPRTPEKEKQIYQDMLDMAERDEIVKNLMIKAGKLQGTVKQLKYLPINIEIIFHMMTNVVNGATVGIVPTTAIDKQMELMNTAFADSGLSFTVKEIKTYSNSAYYSTCYENDLQMKTETTVSPEKYFNVWICLPKDLLGYAYLASDVSETSLLNGVVLNHLSFPAVDGYSPIPEFNEGDTFVHEAGHYFGLYHTFDGGCGDSGDLVSDTAAEASPAYGKACLDNPPRDSCADKPGVDPVTNYMDYPDDSCLNNFTPLQYARMRTIFLKYKPTMASMPPTKAPTAAPTKRPTINCETILDKKPCNKEDSCNWEKVGKVKTCASVPCATLTTKSDCRTDKRCKWKKNSCIKK